MKLAHNQAETIQHVLIKCKKYKWERLKLIELVNSTNIKQAMQSLLQVKEGRNKIYMFIKEIGIERRIQQINNIFLLYFSYFSYI